MAQSDLKSCLKFLGQTFALAKTHSLDIFVGVEIQNQRLWCSNVRQLQNEFMFGGMHFKKKDFWLDHGLIMGNPAGAVKLESENSYESVKTEPDFVSSDLILDGPSKSDNAGHVSTSRLLPSSKRPSNHLDNDDHVSPLPSAHESSSHESSSVHNAPMVSLLVANTPTKDSLNGQDQKSEQMTKASVVLPRLNLPESRSKGNSYLESLTDASREKKPLENHSTTLTPPCDKCGKVFTNPSCRDIHVQRNCADIYIGTDGLPIRPCVKCGLMFNNQDERKAHMNDVHLKCQQCDIVYRSFTSLRLHNEHVHLKLKPHKCLTCGRSFSMKSSLLNHERVIHQGTKKLSVCPICGKSMTTCQVNTHIKRDHMRQRDYACDLCPRKFYNPSSLKLHVNDQHLRIKAYPCKLCDKSFTQSGGLHTHKRFVHSDLKPFHCSKCGKSYKAKAHLHRHQRTHEASL